MLYIFILIGLLFLSYHYDYRKYTSFRLGWYYICLVIFTALCALRYRVGSDTIHYEAMYEYLPSFSEMKYYDQSEKNFGILFLYIVAFCKLFTNKIVLLQIIQSVILNFSLFKFFKDNTRNIFTALFFYFVVFYIYFNFEILRESMAVGVFLFGWQYVKTNRWFYYYICCFIASLIHPSAYVTFVVPLLFIPGVTKFFQFGKQLFIGIIIVAIIASIIYVKLFDYIMLADISDTINSYAEEYGESESYAFRTNFDPVSVIGSIMAKILWPLIALYFIKKYSREYRVNLDRLQVMICCYIYLCIFSTYIYIWHRFTNYFIAFFVLGIAIVLFMKFRTVKLDYAIRMLIITPYIVFVLSAYFVEFSETGLPNYKRYYPYESVLDPKEDRDRESMIGSLY